VNEGGRRGMKVSVTLPAADAASVPAVQQALAAYLFETQVAAG
jgi:fatty-acyl-CoA synthase